MRTFVLHCATIAVLAGSVPNIVWAGSTGRRNTAIAATALAVGAWSNGTGRAGRRNTAIVATGVAAVAWGRYHDKKKQENKRCVHKVVVYKDRPVVHREVVVERRPEVVQREVIVERQPVVQREVVYVEKDHGKHKGWCKGKHKGWGHDHDD